VTLTATSVTDGTKSASATITITSAAAIPIVVGHGQGVRLNVVNNSPVVAWTSAGTTLLNSGVSFPGTLQDLEGGTALTQTTDAQGRNTLFLNGTQVAQEIATEPPVIAGTDAAWIAGGVFTSSNPSQPAYASPAGADLLEIAAGGSYVGYVVESSNQACSVYVDGVDVMDDSNGCPQQLKFVIAGGVAYLGWCDGTGVTIEQTQDGGQTWTVAYTFTGLKGVFGMDYGIRSDGSLSVAWTQYDAGEDGSSVWESDSGGAATRLSAPVQTGFSGAGNPAVASDGSVAWLDDSHGSASGHFDVFLDGVDLSNMDDAIDEGPRLQLLNDGTRVVAWDDDVTVWLDEVPL
jgi:hypothetical protein